MTFPTMLHFDNLDSDEPVQPPFKLRNSKLCSASSLTLIDRLAKALTRLRICAGWSEHLLVAHTRLLEISCHGSNILYVMTCNMTFSHIL